MQSFPAAKVFGKLSDSLGKVCNKSFNCAYDDVEAYLVLMVTVPQLE